MTTTISVPAAKLRLMLTAVLPHAAHDDTFPMLEAVRFEVQGNTLFLFATDRYTMGVARCRIPGATPSPEVQPAASIHRYDADGLLSALKGASGVAALVFGSDSLEVDLGEDPAVTYALADDLGYPDWRAKLGEPLARETGELDATMSLNPVLLARFMVSLADGGEDEATHCTAPLRVRVAGKSPDAPVLLITRDKWFMGAAMPYRRVARHDDPAPEPDEWEDWAVTLAPAKQAAEVSS